MKNSKAIIIKLAKMGVLETKEIPPSGLPEKDELTYDFVNERTNEYRRYKIVTDEHFDDDLPIAIMIKQSTDIKSIKNILKFFVILTILNIVASIISAVSIANMF